MRSLKIAFLATALLLVIVAAACASPSTAEPTEPPVPTETLEPTEVMEPTAVPTFDFAGDLMEFDPSDFDDPTNIDNEWHPMTPGMQRVLEGETEEAGIIIPHRIEFTVTDLTKEIQGVRTVVAYIVDIADGEPIEKEIAFYAQDNDGNVWYFGEYPEVYEFGKLVEAPAWINGYKGAKAGLKMEVDPQLGMPSYSQGWGPAVGWTDRAQVAEMGIQTCVPFDCFDDVMIVEEFSKEEPGAFQLKYYARGFGNVQVGWRGDDATRETLEMVEHRMLSPEELAEIHEEVFEMEARAYDISKEVYDQTSPAELRSTVGTQ